jgi:PRTRC genetic system protein A
MSNKIETIQAEFEKSSSEALRNLSEILTTFGAAVAAEVRAGITRPIAAGTDDDRLPLDNALFDSAPVAAVPRHAEFAPLTELGHRFLLAAEGLFVEIRRPWLHMIQQISSIDNAGPRPPYGSVEPKIEFAFGRLGTAEPHFRRFADEAKDASPNEHAAWIVWDSVANELVYKSVTIKSATPGSIEMERPALADHESLAIDLHSHGRGPAFFSPTDNADDAGEVKIAGVIGGVAPELEKSVVFRLCALGRMIQLKVPVHAFFGKCEVSA